MSDTSPIEQPSWLTSGDFTEADEPFRLFDQWLKDAAGSEPRDPTAMTLATVDAEGMPNARMVLLKGVDKNGFVFYTNMESQKGRELDRDARAALVFHWKSLNRQIRIRGPVEKVTTAEADAYFATRPKGAQIGAWASQQSRPLESRMAFEKSVAVYGAKYALGEVPRPHIGRATACCRWSWSSGTTARSVCMIGSNSAARRRPVPGSRRGSIREL